MKKILLIEDNNEMRENTAEILQLAGYEVTTAQNGKVGVEIAQRVLPDLIICDIMMPVMDGYGTLHLLGRNSNTAGIPFIFLTAKAERSDLRKGMEMGADDYLTKPFDDVELLNAVESRLKKAGLLKKEFSKDMAGLNEFLREANQFNEVRDLSQNRKIHRHKKKDILYMDGDLATGVVFISKGKVKTYKSNEQGKELITGIHVEGDFIGYVDMFENKEYRESAEAMEETETSVIPKEEFFSLLFSNRDVAAKFMKMLSNNLAEREEQLVRLAYNSVRRRIAETLVALHKQYNKNSTVPSAVSISRDDLANLAGTATETTIRTLSDFKEEKLLEIKGSNISILNMEKLSSMKN